MRPPDESPGASGEIVAHLRLRLHDLARARTADRAFVAAAVAAVTIIVFVGRGLTFSTLGDEWTFIETRSLHDLSTWLPAHNEHWSTAFVLVFRALFETVGFRSYLPYLVILAVLHVVVVAGVYVLARGQTRPWIAFALVLPFLVLGSGWENLLIFFQASILMALAAGVWALVALRCVQGRRGTPVAAVLLVLAVMSASAGLLFVVAATIELVATRGRRRLVAVLPAVVAYAAWYALIGPNPVGGQSNPLAVETVVAIAGFAVLELFNAVGAVLGGGFIAGVIGTVLLLSGVVVIAARDLSRLTRATVIGPAAGLAVGFLLVAIGRRQFGAEAAGYGRYVYTSAALLVPMVAALIGSHDLRLPSRTARRLAVAALVVVELSVIGNLSQLYVGAAIAQSRSDTLRAIVGSALGPLRGQVSQTRSVFYVPPPPCLDALVRRFGDPTTDTWFPGIIPTPNPELVSAVREALTGPASSSSPLRVEDLACSPGELAGLR